LNDLIGQLKIVETVPELDKLLLLASLELFLGFLVVPPTRIAFGEECGHR
jgi:hypothetical protein